MLKSHFTGPLVLVLLAILLSGSPISAQENFSRGDCNLDDQINIADAVLSLSILFSGAGPALCPDACDVNDDGNSDISDPVSLLSILFASGGPPPEPVNCGPDPTADGLDCPQTSPGCSAAPVEICDNGADDDSDGLVDCEDPDCVGPLCVEICDNGADDDFDALIDCDDPDCLTDAACIQISYINDVYPQVIDTDCTVCHAPPSNFGGLNLANTSTNDSYATLVNQPSSECSSYDFVEPGDSQASWLFRKIENTHVAAAQAAGCSTAAAGSQMPIGGFCCLTPEQIQLVESWIDQGAAP